MTSRELPSPANSRSTASGIALAAAVVAALSGACSRQPATSPVQQSVSASRESSAIPRADRPPAALTDIGQSAILLFDAANASDWSSAAEDMQTIQEATSVLPLTLPKPDIAGQLQSRLKWLGQHETAKDRIDTMDDANAVMRLSTELSAEFQTDVPFEVEMLGYYGRQLELGIAAGRPDALTHASTDLRSTWNRVEPAIERRASADEVRRFTDIVVRLEGAHKPAQFVAPARAELVEAERFEQLFRSRT